MVPTCSLAPLWVPRLCMRAALGVSILSQLSQKCTVLYENHPFQEFVLSNWFHIGLESILMFLNYQCLHENHHHGKISTCGEH